MKLSVYHLYIGFCFGVSTFQADVNENLLDCITFNRTSGECILLQNCPSLLKLSKQDPPSSGNMFILALSECGASGETKVCCDKEDDTIQFGEEIADPARFRFLGPSGFNPTLCPGNERCIPTRNCKPLLDYLKNVAYTTHTRDYFRQIGCGFEGNDPMVCCSDKPIELISDNTPTEPVKSDLLPNTNVCGISGANRIVGGRVAEIAEFPWLALLEYTSANSTQSGKIFNCGGSLISSRYVLTAAHCITESLISVRLGEYDLNESKDCEYCVDAIDVAIEEKIAHSDFVDHPHDIALIRLVREVTFTDFIRPICLPTTPDLFHKTYVGTNMTVAGWGITENGTSSNVLRKLEVPVKAITLCTSLYGYKTKIPPALFCAGGIKGKDSCQGDSGGPLMTPEHINMYAAGIVSFGSKECGLANWPAVYTKVAYYIQWIVDNMKP